MLNFFLVFLIGFGVSVLLGFPILKLCQKLKLGQTILHYVDKHAGKSGTPTMGGLIFIFASAIASFIFLRGEDFWLAVLSLLTMFGYGLLGFLDDFIKVRGGKNEGLKPYQKIIGQVGLSLIIALFVYFKLGSELDFFGIKINLGIFIIPFIMVFFVAVTNSVNLTDGLDGLAGGVSLVYLLTSGVIVALLGYFNFGVISFAMAGAILGFLLFNGFPAKIFMGDTGSLALGGLIAVLAVMTGLELIMPIIGVMFVLSALSDIIQVGYYKRTHKRVFLMAPLHHHFEKKGVHENRIVAVYIVITLLCGLGVMLGYMAILGVV